MLLFIIIGRWLDPHGSLYIFHPIRWANKCDIQCTPELLLYLVKVGNHSLDTLYCYIQRFPVKLNDMNHSSITNRCGINTSRWFEI